MDFGVAKVLAAAQATNTQSVGTLQYMSPEQIDARTIDARSDLYALGLVLYECLAGRAAVPVGLAARAAQPAVHASPPRSFRRRSARRCRRASRRSSSRCSRSRPTRGPRARRTCSRSWRRSSRRGPGRRGRPARSRGRTARSRPTRSRAAIRSCRSRRPRSRNAPTRWISSSGRRSRGRSRRCVAIALILILSIVAGLTAYVLRLRVVAPAEPASSLDEAPARARTSVRGLARDADPGEPQVARGRARRDAPDRHGASRRRSAGRCWRS